VADELAAVTVGVRPLIEGLRRIHGAALAFEVYWHNEVVPVLSAGYRPPISDGFRRFVNVHEVARTIDRSVEEEIREGKSDIYDTHPALPERIAAAERLPLGEVPDAGRGREAGPNSSSEPPSDPPAISLLRNVEGLEAQLFETLGSEEAKSLKPVAWEEAASQAYLPTYEQLVRENARALRSISPRDLPRVAKDLEAFGRSLLGPGEEVAPEEVPILVPAAVRVLGAGLILALRRAGWDLHVPVGEELFCERAGVRIKPFTIIQQLSAGELSEDEWQRECEQAGIAEMDLGQPMSSTSAG
jgi:hypothetical protein